MSNPLKKREWGWKISGLLLGFAFLITVAVVKPIGVSTQFVILDGIIWNSVSTDLIVKDENAKKGYASSNAYLNKSGGKYAKNIAKPANYSFVFVVAMIVGGLLAYLTGSKQSATRTNTKDSHKLPKVWLDNYGNTPMKRYMFAFFGGILVLFGARLAGGCSSGHMMSGIMQTSISGYLFAIATFGAAIPVAKNPLQTIGVRTMSHVLLAAIFGLLFGFILQKSGASSPQRIIDLLRLKDFHLAKVILLAIGLSSLALFALSSMGIIEAHFSVKTAYVGVMVGGLIFGIGWAVSGFCPGTSVAALGSGKKDAFVFVGGGLIGAFLFMLIYGSLKDTALFDKLLGGKATLANTGVEKYTSLLDSIPATYVAGGIAVLFIAFAFLLPERVED